MILFHGRGKRSRIDDLARMAGAILAGYVVLNLAVHVSWEMAFRAATTPDEMQRICDHDGAPRVFALMFGWIPVAVYVVFLTTVRAIVSFARNRRRKNSP